MAFTKTQKSWLVYDPAISAYAMIVRTVAAPLFLVSCAQGILSESQCTEYWGYACSFAGITAGAISVFLGPKIDAEGRKKHAVAIFTILGVLSTLLYIAVPCCVQESAPYVVVFISFIGIISFMGANSFYDSLLINVTSRTERDKVSSWGFALGYAGALFSFLCCLPLLEIAGGKYFYAGSFLIAALCWGLGALPLLKNVHENTSTGKTPEINIADTLRFIAAEKNIFLFLAAYFLYIDGVGTIMMQAALIAKGLKLPDSSIMLTILALQIIGMPFTLLFGFLAEKFSTGKMILTAIIIYIIIAILVTVMSFTSDETYRTYLFFIAAGLIGTVQGGIQSLSRSLFSRIIPRERAAELFAVYNIFGRFTTLIGPLLMIPVAVHLWNKAELGISLMILPFICGAWLLTKVKVPEN